MLQQTEKPQMQQIGTVDHTQMHSQMSVVGICAMAHKRAFRSALECCEDETFQDEISFIRKKGPFKVPHTVNNELCMCLSSV